MRYKIMLTWVFCFLIMWILFEKMLPKHEFNSCLNNIEKSINNKNWAEAKKSTKELKNIYENNKVIIRTNNATEAMSTFQNTLGQLYISVDYEQETALEYIGALKESLDWVLDGFSAP
ncbi:hypothetical protein [Clostridium sp. UBA4548]|uniref:hypothetical protein n=1 Tax=Clostridium sp. UBA4548 TaxID=1946361 RepID=UPI0025BED324|nr:hypothetical protein [Clostridium sp. UBA4548]